MTLTVIVPDKRPGMQRMLQRELAGIDSEVIYKNWRLGLKKAQGDFILLLEYDSGISKGSIRRGLEPFLDNPHYRKLAMVAPRVEFGDVDVMGLSYPGRCNQCDGKVNYHLSRIGYIAGSIIRRSSLLKYMDIKNRRTMDNSYALSVTFWENGLRVLHEPNSVYQSSGKFKEITILPEVSKKVLKMWTQEMVV